MAIVQGRRQGRGGGGGGGVRLNPFSEGPISGYITFH